MAQSDIVIDIQITSANNLREASWAGGGRSLRFCTCELAGNPKSRVQTVSVDDTQASIWNFTGKLKGFEFGDELFFNVLATNAQFKTWRVTLGEARLRSYLFETEDFEGELPLMAVPEAEQFLQKRDDKSLPATLKVRIKSLQLRGGAVTDFKPKPKQRNTTAAGPLRPIAIPSILEECLKEAKEGGERTQVRKAQAEQEEWEKQSVSSAVKDARGAGGGDGVAPTTEVVRRIEDLPAGWEAAWNEEYQRYYFYNHDLESSTWVWPGDEEDDA